MTSLTDILQKRAYMLTLTRSFFEKKNIMEVDCPSILSYPNLDDNIEIFKLQTTPKRYLHSSPEHAMKRLLSEGVSSIYQLSHVYRKGEIGPYHNPEFTLVEWYRKNVTFSFFLNETLDFIRLFVGDINFTKMSYREIFFCHTNIDYATSNIEKLKKILQEKSIDYASNDKLDKDGYLNLIFSHIIEPAMPKDQLVVIYDFPASQAALSQIKEKGDEMVAERFEIFFQNIELANGYHELTDPKEQRKRFESSIAKKEDNLSIDEKLLQALEKGLGDCFGVAMGFDRLLMLHLNKKTIHEVIPFSWENI